MPAQSSISFSFPIISLLWGVIASSLSGAPTPAAQLFPLDQVSLHEGIFREAQARNLRYVLAHDVDRLVAPYRREAGLPPKAAPYPNWESSGLDGHSAGHYLTALAQHAVVSGSAEARDRLKYMLSELAACQESIGTGYLGGIPGGEAIWEDLANGRLEVDNFSLNGKWVPWYNLHKLFAGLRDGWILTDDDVARDLLIRLGEWCLGVLAPLTDEQVQTMLRCEHGGMNEVLADLAEITGDARYLEAAIRFSEEATLAPLLVREDQLDGLHANTQIPKVIGFVRIAELTGKADWAAAAAFFWDRIVSHRSVAIGGNSVREHFHPADDFAPMIHSREGPETCNTYNMLRLSEQLFSRSPAAHLADYYERALFNHILSSQHPTHGGYVYFTPMRPGHYRVYSQPETCFWCCVGSGMENHGKYGRFIYAHSASELYVNLFIASRLSWPERKLSLVQHTRFPDEERTTLTLALEEASEFTLALRHPAWVAEGAFQVRVNGELVTDRSLPSSYLRLHRNWRSGDRIEIDLPMRHQLEALPDASNYVALLYGPVVLAAPLGGETPGLIADDGRMAHVAPGAYVSLDDAPMLVGSPAEIIETISPVDGLPLRFTAAASIRPHTLRELVLQPFHQIHDTRYIVYWKIVGEAAYREVVAEMRATEAAQRSLEARTIDAVQPGEQQPEVEHAFAAAGPLQGVHLGRTWRAAEEWFEYRLETDDRTPAVLRLTFYAAERDRHFDVLIEGEAIATIHLTGGDPDQFFDYDLPLSPALAERLRSGAFRVRFVAHEDSIAGALYGLRLLAAEHSGDSTVVD